MTEQLVEITTPFIRLDALLKLCSAAESGGAAKVMIQNGEVLFNGAVCTMRGKKVYNGDVVQVAGAPVSYRVTVKFPVK